MTNSGNTGAYYVVITDPLLGGPLTAGVIPILRPGESVVQTQVYDLTAGDLAARRVENQATATGTWRLTSGGAPQTVQDFSAPRPEQHAHRRRPRRHRPRQDGGSKRPVDAACPGDVVTYSFTISTLAARP